MLQRRRIVYQNPNIYCLGTNFVMQKKFLIPDQNGMHQIIFLVVLNIQTILAEPVNIKFFYHHNYFINGYLFSAYVFTVETARSLYNESLSIPLFHLEDVYLTGFVAEKLKLKRTHHPLFFYQFSKDKCSARGMISQHQLPPPEMQELYNFVTNLTINCHTPEKNFLSMKLKLTQRKGCH